jgi:hypothetical protein
MPENPRQTDPDNTRRPETADDERGLLYISDLQALRRADSVVFHLTGDGTAYIDAHLSTVTHPEPRIFTATEQRLFPDIDGSDRRRRIPVTAGIVGFDDKRRWHEQGLPDATASAMIHVARLDELWRSIAAFLRVGDVVSLHWWASNNNGYITQAGLHRDELRLVIRRGRRRWAFLVKVELCPDNTARMIRRTSRI